MMQNYTDFKRFGVVLSSVFDVLVHLGSTWGILTMQTPGLHSRNFWFGEYALSGWTPFLTRVVHVNI